MENEYYTASVYSIDFMSNLDVLLRRAGALFPVIFCYEYLSSSSGKNLNMTLH